jgi:hypothetical protein
MFQNMTAKCRKCNLNYTPRHERDFFCGDCYSRRGRGSKRKGSANETLFAKKLEQSFNRRFQDKTHQQPPYRIRRTPMSGAMHLDWPADVVTLNPTPQYSVLRTLHFDLKHQEKWSPEKWYAEEDELRRATGLFTKVIIIMKRNRGDQFAFMKWDDLQSILLELEAYKREENNE